MEQPEDIETNQDESKIKAGDVENKERKYTNKRTSRENAGKLVDHL